MNNYNERNEEKSWTESHWGIMSDRNYDGSCMVTSQLVWLTELHVDGCHYTQHTKSQCTGTLLTLTALLVSECWWWRWNLVSEMSVDLNPVLGLSAQEELIGFRYCSRWVPQVSPLCDICDTRDVKYIFYKASFPDVWLVYLAMLLVAWNYRMLNDKMMAESWISQGVKVSMALTWRTRWTFAGVINNKYETPQTASGFRYDVQNTKQEWALGETLHQH